MSSTKAIEQEPKAEAVDVGENDAKEASNADSGKVSSSNGSKSNNSDTVSSQNSSNPPEAKKQGRPICERCLRPTPRACICEALPTELVQLQKSRILVLQHPHEVKRKNRSIPVMELCLSSESILVATGRRLGEETSSKMMEELNRRPTLLVYPGDDAVPLEEGLAKLMSATESDGDDSTEKLNILLIDATWKHAREMDRANQREGHYMPSSSNWVVRVVLKPSDLEQFQKRINNKNRFADIRTPPSPDHLSTAECLAWVASRVEEKPEIFETLMKPLDCMVSKWKTFSERKDNRKRQQQPEERPRGSKRKKDEQIR